MLKRIYIDTYRVGYNSWLSLRLLAFACILLMLMPVLRPAAANLLYIAAGDYVATELCEQKEIAGNCCQGSCYVENQLKEESSNKDGWLASQLAAYDWQPLQMDELISIQESFFQTSFNHKPHFSSSSPLMGYLTGILRPPRFT